MKYLYFILLLLVSCGGGETAADVEENDLPKYPDGTYCANVDYYNSSTGTRRTYTLNVEVESNEVTKIIFGNGGYLDNRHITPETLSNGGNCSITDDKNRTFDISINGSACASIDNINDDEDVAEETRITLGQCASTIPMSEEELSDYEREFNTSRNDLISYEWCEKLYDYITKMREINGRRQNMENQMSNGYIQKLHSIGGDDEIRCQTMIVLRNGTYYLLELAGRRRATMGLTNFNPNNSDWQNIAIKENFESTTMPVFEARVVNRSSSMSSLELEMDNYCSF
jgi:hypothetical protein